MINSWPSNGLIERANEKIQTQIEKVEVMTGDMDPKTNFGLIIIQTELERWKYLVRGFLRARLAKVYFVVSLLTFDTKPLCRLTSTHFTIYLRPLLDHGSRRRRSHLRHAIKLFSTSIIFRLSCSHFLPN